MFVKNWKQVYKSLAVWLPVVVLAGIEAANAAMGLDLVPAPMVPVVAGITGAVGWVISQNKTVISIKNK